MSSTELFTVTKSGRVSFYAETRNSHLGAMFVWCNLYKRYFEDRIKKYREENGWEPTAPVTQDDYKELWGLFEKCDLPEFERAVLGSTFDYVMLERQHFKRFYDDVLKYAVYFPAGTLIKQAQHIMKLEKRQMVAGVCWNQTSVNGDMFYKLKNKAKAGELWSLYQALDGCKEVTP